ncbi:DUF2309 domain-containing protein [Nonlabens agnitus]|uniref:Probable inorganic carbon transporter subunit DabA n=1 Tax=Nonlabens agnitus TaxID=870484 RepID=A0A2S9WXT5_9FLAO|nr:DUF2309 domain-containing protein [Nonlabens agnitus]PRP68196.1 DUF2309 domain-containing protein [Nonlabens agnitus]
MKVSTFKEQIEQASKVIGHTWPLYSFVTSNPLSGYEDIAFAKAIQKAQKALQANLYPDYQMLSKAYDQGLIETAELEAQLREHHITLSPTECLDLLSKPHTRKKSKKIAQLDQQMSKWLAAFMDEGLAEWSMPFREKGFYQAWKKLLPYEKGSIQYPKELPQTSEEALESVLAFYNVEDYEQIFSQHLAALPGWTGYINHRNHYQTEWQQAYPITNQDYLAVRLLTAQAMQMPLLNTNVGEVYTDQWHAVNLAFLKAWEHSYQNKLVATLQESDSDSKPEAKTPDAQFVFCIDTRSEQIRRHIEAAGDYETFGYAGFFGIAMDYQDEEQGINRKSCPPIVPSAYTVRETARPQQSEKFEKRKKSLERTGFHKYFLTRMKNMLPSAFGFVEGAGALYGGALLGRTALPRTLYKKKQQQETHEHFCDTAMVTNDKDHQHPVDTLEKAKILKGAFELMGWADLAPVIILAGHGSHTANNPFGSSLDCGACAASPGRNNARLLAQIGNDPAVRNVMDLEFDIQITDKTIFIAAEHNTTTDEIILFDSHVPETHKNDVSQIKADLKIVQENATKSRLKVNANATTLAETKANDWSETRPEWGLAKNAGFIIGHRSLTKSHNLDGRCFLHSYNWEQDETGAALETIMQGPMTVTQWINNHYYFSTVSNKKLGGGTKVFHNVTGHYGVVEGNGGDLKMGLPLESVNATDQDNYHEPLRLSVIIQSPLERVEKILANNERLKGLIENQWIHLLVMDPSKNDSLFKYDAITNWFKMTNQYANQKMEVSVPI